MHKLTFWWHTSHTSTRVRRVMQIFVTLIGWNSFCALHKTAGGQLPHTRCSDFDKPCFYHLLIHPCVITFCQIRLSNLSWAFMNFFLYSEIFSEPVCKCHSCFPSQLAEMPSDCKPVLSKIQWCLLHLIMMSHTQLTEQDFMQTQALMEK